MKKRLKDCRTGKDFDRYLKKCEDVEVTSSKGSHKKAKNDKGTAVYYHSNSQYPKGMLCALIKQLARMGIFLFVAGIIFVMMYGG